MCLFSVPLTQSYVTKATQSCSCPSLLVSLLHNDKWEGMFHLYINSKRKNKLFTLPARTAEENEPVLVEQTPVLSLGVNKHTCQKRYKSINTHTGHPLKVYIKNQIMTVQQYQVLLIGLGLIKLHTYM